MVVLLAALTVGWHELHLGDAWSGEQIVRLYDPQSPAEVIEEDHYRIDDKVVEVRPDGYVVEVGRLQTESISDGKPIPMLKGGKPNLTREIWKRTGELDFDPKLTGRAAELLRLERPLHIPFRLLTEGESTTTSGAKWTRLAIMRDKAWDHLAVSYQETGVQSPITAKVKVTFFGTTGMVRDILAILENAPPVGGEMRLTIEIQYRKLGPPYQTTYFFDAR